MQFPTDIQTKKHYAMKRMAEVMGAKVLCMNNRANGLAEVLGFDASPNTIDELLSTNVILSSWL